MIDPDATSNFNGADISLSDEYHQARKMMGTKGTDMELLYRNVSHIYITIQNDDWANAYLALMQEIQDRQNLLMGLPITHGFQRRGE